MKEDVRVLSTQTIRVSSKTHEELRELSRQVGESMQAVVEMAVEEWRRKRFFEQTNEAYMALRNDPPAWENVTEERTAWEQTLGDGLDKTGETKGE
jgi:hypothetical protein